MRYEDFRNAIHAEHRRNPTDLTWPQLQARLALPYARPGPTWVKRLEQEIGLTRTKGPRAAYLWKLPTPTSPRRTLPNTYRSVSRSPGGTNGERGARN